MVIRKSRRLLEKSMNRNGSEMGVTALLRVEPSLPVMDAYTIMISCSLPGLP